MREPRKMLVYCAWLCVVICLCAVGAPVQLYAQGFDWQYSARLPTGYPSFFVGLSGTVGGQQFSGDIHYTQGVVLCGAFSEGSGKGISIGVQVDDWITPWWTLTGALRYESFNGLFSAAGDTLQRAPNAPPTIVAYEIDSDFSYGVLDVGARYRPFPSAKVFVGAGVQLGVLLSHSTVQRQRIVSPAEQRFADGSQEQSLRDNITGFRSFFAAGRVSAGIDIPLAKSLYASPALYASIPVLSMVPNTSWQRVGYGVQVSIVYGLW